MRASPSDPNGRSSAVLLAVLVSAGALVAGPAQAQTGSQAPAPDQTRATARDASIVSKSVSFGTGEAGLTIATAGGAALRVRFEDGTVFVDAVSIGSYEPGGTLEQSWRSLVARSVQLDDGPLAEALIDWQPPEGLGADAAAIAARIDTTLEALLVADARPADAPPAANVVDGVALSELLSRLDVLGAVGGMLGDLQLDDLRIVVGEDFEVARGMVIDGSVLVVDGDVEIAGRILGDLLVADGDIDFRDGGVVEGNLRYSDGSLDLDDGSVLGDIREIEGGALVVDADFREELRDQIRSDVEAELRATAPRSRERGVFRRLAGSFGDVIETLLTIFVLGLFGVMINFFAGENIDRVAEAARRSPGRAATVGMAAGFLAIPVWIVGSIGLAITIIGIPALIVWVPGFPIVVLVAAGLGYVAVARNVGTWVTHQNIPGLEWVSVTRPNSLIFGGIAVLMAPYLAAAVLGFGGDFLAGLEGLAIFVGIMLGLASTAVGFGAVLVTRGGRRTDYGGDDWYSDLQDLGSELGDLRGYATDFGRRWTRGDRTDVPDAGFGDGFGDEWTSTGRSAPEADRPASDDASAAEGRPSAEPEPAAEPSHEPDPFDPSDEPLSDAPLSDEPLSDDDAGTGTPDDDETPSTRD